MLYYYYALKHEGSCASGTPVTFVSATNNLNGNCDPAKTCSEAGCFGNSSFKLANGAELKVDGHLERLKDKLLYDKDPEIPAAISKSKIIGKIFFEFKSPEHVGVLWAKGYILNVRKTKLTPSFITTIAFECTTPEGASLDDVVQQESIKVGDVLYSNVAYSVTVGNLVFPTFVNTAPAGRDPAAPIAEPEPPK